MNIVSRLWYGFTRMETECHRFADNLGSINDQLEGRIPPPAPTVRLPFIPEEDRILAELVEETGKKGRKK